MFSDLYKIFNPIFPWLGNMSDTPVLIYSFQCNFYLHTVSLPLYLKSDFFQAPSL